MCSYLTVLWQDTPDERGKIRSSSVTVFVNVQDIEDSPPVWIIPPTIINVDENNPQVSHLTRSTYMYMYGSCNSCV